MGYRTIQALILPHRTTITCQSPALLPTGWMGTQDTAQGSTPLLCWLSVADCKAPPELEHGFVAFSSRNNLTTYRATVQYHCQHPYYHMAPNSTGEQWNWAVSPWHGVGGRVAMRVCVCKRGKCGMASPGCSASSRLWM